MAFDISKALKAPEERFDVKYTIELDKIVLAGNEYEITRPVSLEGYYYSSDKKIFLKAEVQTSIKSVCARCLKDVESELRFDISEKFASDDEDAYPLLDKMIDLEGVIEESVILNLPKQVLCNEDCKGLCPKCGTDLNINECKCDKEEIDPNNPFAALKDFIS